MVNFGNTPPLVGLDASGNPINLVVSANNQAVTSPSAAAIGTQSSTSSWQEVSVVALYHDTVGTLGLGYGKDASGNQVNLAFTNISGQWIIGPTPIAGIKTNGIEDVAGLFYIADSGNRTVYQSDFNYANPSPAGGFSPSNPVIVSTSINAIDVDTINSNGTTIVAASSTHVGTFTPNGAIQVNGVWDHNAGEVVQVTTGHQATSYTFPGYAGANPQIQVTYAIPTDTGATTWDVPNLAQSQGYYGVTGAPQVTVNWL